MNLHQIRYPLAIFTETGSLVHASDVVNGLNCKCHCPFCNEKLIAINKEDNKREDHFRHRSDTKCKANYETFIHWLSKQVIKGLAYITLPSIDSSQLGHDNDFLQERSGILTKYGLDPFLLNSRNEKIQNETRIAITECRDEVWTNTKLGPVKPDIVLYHGQSKFFIEPFFTNPINDEKLRKLIQSDTSVVSIDLRPFALNTNPIFTLEKFTAFLQDETKYKRWAVIRREKIEKIRRTYLTNLERRLTLKTPMISTYKTLGNTIENFQSEINECYKQIHKLEENISAIQNQRREIEAELGTDNDIE